MANENIVSGKKYKVLQNGVWKLFSFFTKASDVEFDDGMNAEEKIQFIEENGVGVELTLAEYEALSEEEKNNGTYWINDTNEPLGDGSRFLKTTDVVDSLDVADPTAPLSANMGKKIYDSLTASPYINNVVNMSSYINTNNYFLTESDGYLAIECAVGENNQCYVQESYSNTIICIARSNGTLNGFASIYLKKDMRVCLFGTSGAVAKWHPLLYTHSSIN